jgi:protein SCO1
MQHQTDLAAPSVRARYSKPKIESVRVSKRGTGMTTDMKFREALIGTLALYGTLLAAPAALADSPAGATDDHAHHHLMAATSTSTRSVASYQVPDVGLVRDDGKPVGLRAELDDGRPVVLAFIYTSCTTVCPLTSHTLSELQTKLGADRDRVHLVSISIDPEQDTPARLRDYAKTFSAGPEWQHYTGTRMASETAQRAFDVYRGAKMDHSPATLVRSAPGEPWVRIDGFATADQLYAELPNLAKLSAAR